MLLYLQTRFSFVRAAVACIIPDGISGFEPSSEKPASRYWWVSSAPEFQCCYFCESSCLFSLSFDFDFYVSKIMHLWVRILPRKPNN